MNFLNWIKGAVSFLSSFLTKDRMALIGVIIQLILTALREVDKMKDMSDAAKRATAFGLLTEDLPKIIEYGVKLKKIEDATGKGCLTAEGRVDSDCDGVEDPDDACPNDPDCQ